MPESPFPAPAATSEARPSPSEYREQRLANLAELQARGHAPFGAAFARTGRVADIRDAYAENLPVKAAGRVMSVRDMGKTVFADLRDGSGRIQLFVNKNHLGEDAFGAFKFVDLGDHVGAEGTMKRTRRGELSLRATSWQLLTKSLRPLPEKFHGLTDVELRYRQRYFDSSRIPSRAPLQHAHGRDARDRAVLESRGFQEVETPMMQPQPAAPRASFTSTTTPSDCTSTLRIAPELYLKRLLVGASTRSSR